MDSGIDSTESSNGSVEAGGGEALDCSEEPPQDLPGEVMEEEQTQSSPDIVQPPRVEHIAVPTNSPNVSPQHFFKHARSGPMPDALKSLAAAAASSLSSLESCTNNNNETVGLQEPSSTESTLLKMENNGNEVDGNKPSLSFENNEDGASDILPDVSGTSFEMEPPAGLTFANISPSMYLSRGYEAYSQGYAVQPYENNQLQTKIRNLRLRMRQHHYQIISSKAKERKLRIATSLNNVESVEQLLIEGVEPCVTDEKKRSPLHIAASKGYIEIARLLLKYGANPNQKDAIGNTALHLAACTSNIPLVILLLKAGTNVTQRDNQGYSPLHLARSKLKLIQRDTQSSVCEIRHQVIQIIDLMTAFIDMAGNQEQMERLSSFKCQHSLDLQLADLSISDSRKEVTNELEALLDSLQI